MLEVTKAALDMIGGYMREQKLTSPLRVYLSAGG
jgi:hypothetical protein